MAKYEAFVHMQTAAALDKVHEAAIGGIKKSIGHLEIIVEKIINEDEAVLASYQPLKSGPGIGHLAVVYLSGLFIRKFIFYLREKKVHVKEIKSFYETYILERHTNVLKSSLKILQVIYLLNFENIRKFNSPFQSLFLRTSIFRLLFLQFWLLRLKRNAHHEKEILFMVCCCLIYGFSTFC
jgi:hypothetical protein